MKKTHFAWIDVAKAFGIVTVFCFISCLVLIQIAFAIIVLSYLFAHYYAATAQMKTPVPWSADVTFIAISYYAFGYYLKKYIHIVLSFKTFIVSSLFVLAFTVYDYKQDFFYSIDLKPNVYNHLLLDFIVPVTICFAVFYISDVLARTKVRLPLSQIGASSITIMFLHRVANDFFTHFFEYGIVVFTVIGVVAPYVFFVCVRWIPIVQLMFLEIMPRKRSRSRRRAIA